MADTHSRTPGLVSDAFGAMVVRAVGLLLLYATTTLIAVNLGPDQFGIYTAAISLAMLFATFAPLGSDQVLVRNLSNCRTTEERGLDTALTHLCSGLMATAIFVLVVAVCGISLLLSESTSWQEVGLLAAPLFIPLLLTYLRQWTAVPLVGTRAAILPEQTVLPAMILTLMLVLRWQGIHLTARTLAMVYFLSMSFVWVLSLSQPRLLETFRAAWHSRVSLSQLQQRCSEGLPFVGMAVGAVIIQKCLPLIIGGLCGFESMAHFALALQYAALSSIPLGAIGLTIIPRCARHYRANEMHEASQIVRTAASASFATAVLIAAGTHLLTPWLVGLLGQSYAGIQPLLPALLLSSVIDCLTGPSVPVIQTMNLERKFARALLVFIPVQLLLIYVSCLIDGVRGAAIGYMLSRIIWNVVMSGIIYRSLGIISLPSFQLTLSPKRL